jgi:hypothetical protein
MAQVVVNSSKTLLSSEMVLSARGDSMRLKFLSNIMEENLTKKEMLAIPDARRRRKKLKV